MSDNLNLNDKLALVDYAEARFAKAFDFIRNMIRGNKAAHNFAVAELERGFEAIKEALGESK